MSRFRHLLFLGISICLFDGVAATEAARESGFIPADDGTRLYYVEQGSGPEVLVAPVALYLEPHLLDELSEHRRVVFYDTRNRGRSDAGPLENVSLDRQIEDLEALRKSLGIEQMALLGWSGLGMEMAVYSLKYPHRVSHLIQMSPVPPAASIMRESGDARVERMDRTALDALDARGDAGEFDHEQQLYCRLRNALTNPSNFVDAELANQVPDVCVYENEWPKNLWPFFGALLPSFGDYDWRADLHDLNIPRLIIHGREDGIPLAGAEAWAAGYANARLLVLTPAGHFPFIEQKHAVVDAINTFLDGKWPDGAIVVGGSP